MRIILIYTAVVSGPLAVARPSENGAARPEGHTRQTSQDDTGPVTERAIHLTITKREVTVNYQSLKPIQSLAVWTCLTIFTAGYAIASGTVGDHVNDMSAHLDEYNEEVVWLIGKVDGIVATYEVKGAAAAKPEKVVDYWEAVAFHSAIEINYIPLYSSIWQGLFGVSTAIAEGEPISTVREQQAALDQAL